MLLLLLIMAALLLLTLADADLWPQGSARDYRARRTRPLPKRLTRRKSRSLLGSRPNARGELAKWWWE